MMTIERPRSSSFQLHAADRGLLVLVALAPCASEEGVGDAGPISGACGQKLSRMAGLQFPDEFLALFERHYLLEQPCSRDKTQVAAHANEIRVAAAELQPRLTGRRCIILGRAAAEALGVHPRRPLFAPVRLTWQGLAWVMPEPTDESTWWLKAANRRRAKIFLEQAVAAARVTRGAA